MSPTRRLTLKEVFLTSESSAKIADRYVRKMKDKQREPIYDKLNKIVDVVEKLQSAGLSPVEAYDKMRNFFAKFPELNPENEIDTIGLKMFIQNSIEDSDRAGKLKRYYENIIMAMLKDKFLK